MKKLFFLSVAFVALALTSCLAIFPQTASITVKNDLDIPDAFLAASDLLSNNLDDVYIARSTQPISETVSIAKGDDYTFEISWFGTGRTNLALSRYTRSTSGSEVSAPLQSYSIQDVGHGDVIEVKVTNTATGTHEFEVSKKQQ